MAPQKGDEGPGARENARISHFDKDTYGNLPCAAPAGNGLASRPTVAILVFEPDPARAATIRHIVSDVVRAELRLVRSKDSLLKALGSDIPDLMLVPPLLSSADEAELLAHLSTLRDSGHLEILVTPFRFGSAVQPQAAQNGWRRWWQAKSPPQEYACDPRAFAEQLAWSLRRAQEVRQERSSLPPVMPDAITIADTSARVSARASDRRAHRRFAADELHGLRTARIKYGPQVKLVDCSAGGALIESELPLQPDSEAMLELIGDVRHSTVPFRVIRCHVSAVESRVLYWGACVFTQPLELDDLLQPPTSDSMTSHDRADRFDIMVKTIVERDVSPDEQLRELSTLLHEVSRLPAGDPREDSIKEILAITIAALQRGDTLAVAFSLIEERLDAALPSLTARFAAAPALITTADKETLYLNIPAAGGNSLGVLNVELPRGAMLEDWQFRLLKASTYLASLLVLAPATTDGSQDRRRDIRVRGRFDGKRLGPIDMPVKIHDISESGCFVYALNEEETGQRLTLALHLPDEGWITVKAEVVSSRPGGFAVRFIDVSDDIRVCIARMVAARAESSSSPQSLIA